MNYKLITAGEGLAYFVDQYVLAGGPWDKLVSSLLYTGRAEALCEFFREIAVINLTCRIVTAGISLLKELPTRPARTYSDTSFQQDLRDFIRERLYIRPPLSNDVLRIALGAVTSSQRDPSTTDRSSFKRWAERQHSFCYMCGVNLDFTEQDKHRKFSLDHIWPQRYGGDSIEDNWLPACGSCNARKKRDFASWAMPGIQSVVLGFSPSADEYTRVDGTHRFAMHYLMARKLAIRRKSDLKRAFIFLGPWQDPRLTDEYDLGDFFNLVNHRPELEGY